MQRRAAVEMVALRVAVQNVTGLAGPSGRVSPRPITAYRSRRRSWTKRGWSKPSRASGPALATRRWVPSCATNMARLSKCNRVARISRQRVLDLRTVAKPDPDFGLLLGGHLGVRLPKGSKLVQNVVEKNA